MQMYKWRKVWNRWMLNCWCQIKHFVFKFEFGSWKQGQQEKRKRLRLKLFLNLIPKNKVASHKFASTENKLILIVVLSEPGGKVFPQMKEFALISLSVNGKTKRDNWEVRKCKHNCLEIQLLEPNEGFANALMGKIRLGITQSANSMRNQTNASMCDYMM